MMGMSKVEKVFEARDPFGGNTIVVWSHSNGDWRFFIDDPLHDGPVAYLTTQEMLQFLEALRAEGFVAPDDGRPCFWRRPLGREVWDPAPSKRGLVSRIVSRLLRHE